VSSRSPIVANFFVQSPQISGGKLVRQLYPRNPSRGDTSMHGFCKDPVRWFMHTQNISRAWYLQ
jgi:hypothetical protein